MMFNQITFIGLCLATSILASAQNIPNQNTTIVQDNTGRFGGLKGLLHRAKDQVGNIAGKTQVVNAITGAKRGRSSSDGLIALPNEGKMVGCVEAKTGNSVTLVLDRSINNLQMGTRMSFWTNESTTVENAPTPKATVQYSKGEGQLRATHILYGPAEPAENQAAAFEQCSQLIRSAALANSQPPGEAQENPTNQLGPDASPASTPVNQPRYHTHGGTCLSDWCGQVKK